MSWHNATSSADWEPPARLPRGLRHPRPGEVEEIIQLARRRSGTRNRFSKNWPRHSPDGRAMNIQDWLRRVSAAVDRELRDRKIFMEGA